MARDVEVIIQVCADYQQVESHVFIEDAAEDWKSVNADEVQDGDQIIACTYCKKPAVVLDHFYPYGNDRTRCAEHRNQNSGWKQGKNGYWHYFIDHHSACWKYETEYSGGGVTEPGAKVCERCRQRWARDEKRLSRK